MNGNEVHIVDDDDAVRESLSFLLTTAGYATRTYQSGDRFAEVLDDISDGCLVTDIRMPGMSGIDLLKLVRSTGKLISVIVITGHGDVPLAVEAMKLGASEFLEKPFDDERLLAAVRMSGERRDRAAGDSVVRSRFRKRFEALSRREREVLRGLVVGHQNKAIAHDLGISPRTVEVYRANLMNKMRAGSLSELVRMSLTAGLDSSDDYFPDT
jgi:two-component system response regulator FixJ